MIRTIIGVFLLLAVACSNAQDIPDPMKPPRLVNDFAGILEASQAEELERRLVAFSDTNSTQIVVVTVSSLNGYDVADFAQRLGQKWGVGQKDTDNGVVILVKPKAGNESGKVNISTGYGLEPIIPDAIVRRIIDHEMVPKFSQDDYYGGISAAADVVMGLAAGNFTADDYQKQTGGNPLIGLLVPVIAILLILYFIRRGRSSYYNEGRSNLPFWAALWMLGSMGGGRSGSWGNFSSGSGGFGGSGSGGFGGFGGGSFGGGGASGSW
ncbi:MAG: TPM domain-containing protein [Bacteroidales bacterium]|nr:TPM domain-containing protein [Bacteroidales bacterium]